MSTSVLPGTSTDTEAPSVVEKDNNEDILVATTILQQCEENFFKVLGNSEAP